MITRPYLLSTTSSSSSMGGLMIPSSAGVPATVCLPDRTAKPRDGPRPPRPLRRRLISRLGRHQGYQLSADISDRGVDERDVELTLRSQLRARRFQPLLDHLHG